MKKRGTKGITTMIAVVLAIITLVVGLVVGMVVEGTTRALFPVPEVEELEDRIDELEAELAAAKLTGPQKIGALLTMTGDLATFGENEKCAAELAVAEVNDFLEEAGEEWTLELVVEDTACEPEICLSKVESLNARDIKLCIGPLSSGELEAIKTYCDTNKILVISQSSTTPVLAIPDDYIFRFCPTDKLGQGPCAGRLFYDDGIECLIAVWRGDAWGDGLKQYAELRFEELTGEEFFEEIRYSAEAVEFSAEAAAIDAAVADARAAGYPDEQIGVYVISFEEIVAIFEAVMDYSTNGYGLKWYGSDGTALSGALLDDPEAAAFAETTGFINPIFAPTESEKFQKVRDHVNATLGREAESYAYAIYDMIWVYAYCLLTVHKYDAEAVRAVMPDVAASLFGAAGWTVLDENGDREVGDYLLWVIDAGAWKEAGRWFYATDTIEWV